MPLAPGRADFRARPGPTQEYKTHHGDTEEQKDIERGEEKVGGVETRVFSVSLPRIPSVSSVVKSSFL